MTFIVLFYIVIIEVIPMGEDEKQELLDKELVEIEAKLAARSMSGSPSRRNPNRKMKMTYRDYRNRLIAFGVSISVATGLLIGLTGSHIRKMSDERALKMIRNDFKESVMANLGDSSEERAKYLKSAGEFNRNLYLMYDEIGSDAIDNVLSHTYYGSLEEYLKAHHWDNPDEWSSDMLTILLVQSDINQKQSQLDQMTDEHQFDTKDEETTYGGAK